MEIVMWRDAVPVLPIFEPSNYVGPRNVTAVQHATSNIQCSFNRNQYPSDTAHVLVIIIILIVG